MEEGASIMPGDRPAVTRGQELTDDTVVEPGLEGTLRKIIAEVVADGVAEVKRALESNHGDVTTALGNVTSLLGDLCPVVSKLSTTSSVRRSPSLEHVDAGRRSVDSAETNASEILPGETTEGNSSSTHILVGRQDKRGNADGAVESPRHIGRNSNVVLSVLPPSNGDASTGSPVCGRARASLQATDRARRRSNVNAAKFVSDPLNSYGQEDEANPSVAFQFKNSSRTSKDSIEVPWMQKVSSDISCSSGVAKQHSLTDAIKKNFNFQAGSQASSRRSSRFLSPAWGQHPSSSSGVGSRRVSAFLKVPALAVSGPGSSSSSRRQSLFQDSVASGQLGDDGFSLGPPSSSPSFISSCGKGSEAVKVFDSHKIAAEAIRQKESGKSYGGSGRLGRNKKMGRTLNVYALDALNSDKMFTAESAQNSPYGSEEKNDGPQSPADPELAEATKVPSIEEDMPDQKPEATPSEIGEIASQQGSASAERRRQQGASLVDLQRRQNNSLALLDNSPLQVEKDLYLQEKMEMDGACFLQIPQAMFCICGMVPFGPSATSQWYARVWLLVLLLLFYPYIYLLQGRYFYAHLSKLCLTLGCWVGIAVLHAEHDTIGLLFGIDGNLERYAHRSGYLQDWYLRNIREFFVASTFWLIITCVWILLAMSSNQDCRGTIFSSNGNGLQLSEVISPIFTSSIFAVFSYFYLVICGNLELMVDSFCWHFFHAEDIVEAATEWNKLQATMRRSANAIDSCFLATQTSVLAASLLMGAELWAGEGAEGKEQTMRNCVAKSSSAILVYVPMALYGLFRAAAISEKCSRVPSLLNSLQIGDEPMHPELQYLVQYIQHSAAGFYVKGVRLTAFNALKITYLAGVLCFMFLTRTGAGST